MPSNSTISALIFGGIGIISISLLFTYFFWKKAPTKHIQNKAINKPKDKTNESIADSSSDQVRNSVVDQTEVIVEDVDEDEIDDEEEIEENEIEAVNQNEEELKQLKSKYEDANRLATKFINGQKFDRAIEKLSEAIDLAPLIPNAGKDIMTLYNNRSAMYEKLELFDKALNDITVVLAMEAFHMKARVRRARIFEQQNDLLGALDEYVLVTVLQQNKGDQASHQLKIDSIAKDLAQKSIPNLWKKMNEDNGGAQRVLPSRSHCRNFLESYPSQYSWREKYNNISSKEELSSNFVEVCAKLEENPEEENISTDVLQGILEFVCYDLIKSNYEEAFNNLKKFPLAAIARNHNNENLTLTSLPKPVASIDAADAPAVCYTCLISPFAASVTLTTSLDNMLYSLYYELVGFERHLRCNLTGAVDAYKQSLSYMPENIDVRLKLANAYVEMGDVGTAKLIFDEMVSFFNELSAITAGGGGKHTQIQLVLEAWTILHRAVIFVTRDELGNYQADAIEKAMKDVNQAISMSGKLLHIPAGKYCKVTSLIRSVHILTQNKNMLGQDITDEDKDQCSNNISEAKALDSNNDLVLLLEAEFLSSIGNIDEALQLLDNLEERDAIDKQDCTPYFVKAHIIICKAMLIFSNPHTMTEALQVEAKHLIIEAENLYKKALLIEPNSIELINQYAQFSSMMRSPDKAVTLLKQAISLARTKDDLQELSQLLIANEAYLKAFETLNSSNN